MWLDEDDTDDDEVEISPEDAAHLLGEPVSAVARLPGTKPPVCNDDDDSDDEDEVGDVAKSQDCADNGSQRPAAVSITNPAIDGSSVRGAVGMSSDDTTPTVNAAQTTYAAADCTPKRDVVACWMLKWGEHRRLARRRNRYFVLDVEQRTVRYFTRRVEPSAIADWVDTPAAPVLSAMPAASPPAPAVGVPAERHATPCTTLQERTHEPSTAVGDEANPGSAVCGTPPCLSGGFPNAASRPRHTPKWQLLGRAAKTTLLDDVPAATWRYLPALCDAPPAPRVLATAPIAGAVAAVDPATRRCVLRGPGLPRALDLETHTQGDFDAWIAGLCRAGITVESLEGQVIVDGSAAAAAAAATAAAPAPAPAPAAPGADGTLHSTDRSDDG
eukprot:TRINITY_DN3732_c0_g1_i1.p1 TRINITY_DN3732_c0_g1~~TRINITY_DN3732_c0_g1_i1.p1  ORF type:complete len:386 (-),score=56.61 TRINITY_DN3732_c0_g1_i1:48-1205(-)